MSVTARLSVMPRCGLCTVILGSEGDDMQNELCVDHKNDPRARAMRPGPVAVPPKRGPRSFTAADKSLIRNTHGYMPTVELLRILNERMHGDVGADAPDYTLEQLHAELRDVAGQTDGSGGWTQLRKVLGQARRSGLLEQISLQLIDDFAVVYQLVPAQVMQLRDVIRGAKEGS
jgi:hypothetical protein